MNSAITSQKRKAFQNRVAQSVKLLRPPPPLTVSEWANKYRKLSRESSAEPGQYSTDRAAFQKGWQDAFNEEDVHTVVLMKSAQVGGTETFLNNVAGYFIDQDPSPVIMILPTLELAESFSKERFSLMLRDTPVLQGRVKDPRAKDSNNTILQKSFPGGNLTLAGANSPSSLGSRPKRVVLLSEVDRYPESAGTEGDPVSLVMKRSTTFFNRIAGLESTPNIKGASRIETAFEASDQRRYFVPCPHCKEMQTLRWSNFEWDKVPDGIGGIEEHLHETVLYRCDHCAAFIDESEKMNMLQAGEWRAKKPFNGTAGFHIWEAYSPWVAWSDIVRNFVEAKKFPDTFKVFVNTTLGETWEVQGESIEKQPLMNRREHYEFEIPNGVLVVTASVDVQGDRLEIEWRGWGVDEETWGLKYQVIHGDPTANELWDVQLDEALSRTFMSEAGIEFRTVCVTIDSGFLSEMVYRYCKSKQPGRFYPTKGSSERGKPVVSKMSKNNKMNVSMFILGTDTAKDLVYGRLKVDQPGPGYCHFPLEYEEDYFEQLTSEQAVTKFSNGISRRVWELKKGQKRNEALDIFCGNYAALKILNPNVKKISEKILTKEKEIKENQFRGNEDSKAKEANDYSRTKRLKPRRNGYMTKWKS